MFAGGFLKFGRGGGLFLSNVPKQSTGASRVLKMEKKTDNNLLRDSLRTK